MCQDSRDRPKSFQSFHSRRSILQLYVNRFIGRNHQHARKADH